MLLTLLVVLLCPGDAVYAAYARRDTTALRYALATAPTRADSLLARYRLFPLTGDQALIADLPEQLAGGSATEHALLAALWGYRVEGAGPLGMMRNGARSQAALEAARDLEPANPWVLLVDAQSLLYRPRIVGGDPRAAGDRLALLRERLRADPVCGLALEEVMLWQWRVAERTGDHSADSVRRVLLARDPSPLVREMLDGAW